MVVDEVLEEGRQERRFLAYDMVMLNGRSLVDHPWMVGWAGGHSWGDIRPLSTHTVFPDLCMLVAVSQGCADHSPPRGAELPVPAPCTRRSASSSSSGLWSSLGSWSGTRSLASSGSTRTSTKR